MLTMDCPTESSPAPEQDLPSYSPGRLKVMLRLKPYMVPGDSRVQVPEELEGLIAQLGYRSFPDDAECDYYSLVEALHWLYQRDPRAELAIRLRYCVDMTEPAVAAALHVSRMTVYRWCRDGIELMAWHTGWRDPDKAQHPFAVPD